VTDSSYLQTAVALSGLGTTELWHRCLGYGSQLSQAGLSVLLADPDAASSYERCITAVVANEALQDNGIPYLAEPPSPRRPGVPRGPFGR